MAHRLDVWFKARTLALASALALTAFAFSACTTEAEDDESGDRTYAQIIGDWRISAATVNPVAQLPAIIGVPTIPTTANLLLILDNCDKNAITSFRADGTYLNAEPASCNQIDTGSWTRSDSTLYVTYTNRDKDPDTLTILEVNDSTFRLRERNADLPDRVLRTILWTLVRD